MNVITSKANEKIKHLRRLMDDRGYREEMGLYVIEGLRALEGLSLTELYVREGTIVSGSVAAEKIFAVAATVFDGTAPTGHSQGLLGVARMRLQGSETLSPQGCYVLLDRLQDLGNMGTIIRTARAFGFDGIILTPGTVDPYAPKVVRASTGSAALMPFVPITSLDAVAGHTLIAADTRGTDLASFAWPASFILAIGNEANGISDEVRARAAATVAIAMPGGVESLNAAVSAGIILYAARRFSRG